VAKLTNNVQYLSKERKYEKVLFVSDIHAPYQDNTAIRAMIAFAKEFKPDRIILMGDVIDFYALSSFSKDPIRALKLQKELDEAVSVLRIIRREFPKAKIDFLKGNHENRLQRFLWNKASELSGLRNLTLPNLLKFDELNIIYHSTGRMKYRGKVVKHGNIVRKYSAYTARGELDSTGISGFSVHTHRAGVHFQTNEGGKHFWYEFGCLCKLNAEYMEGKTPNWQQAFGIGYFKLGSAKCNVHIIPIINGKALFRNKEYFGKKK
jgi:predicted phosphodiesterase